MLTNRLRRFKIGISLVALIAGGIFHNGNEAGDPFRFDSYDQVSGSEFERVICLSNVGLQREEGKLFAVRPKRHILLLNLPESVHSDWSGNFAIKGRLIVPNRLVVEKIRRKHPRILKLTCSVVTALVACSLFFIFFRIMHRGITSKTGSS